MNLIYFSLFSLLIIGLLVFFEKKTGNNAIFLFGIGSIINASIFNIYSFPIASRGAVLGMEFLLQPVFFFCLFFMFKKDGKKSAKTMLFVSALSLLFSATIQASTSVISNGYAFVYLEEFILFALNIISYLVSGLLLIFLFSKTNSLQNSARIYFLFLVTNLLNFCLIFTLRAVIFGKINLLALATFVLFNFLINFAFVFLLGLSKKNDAKKEPIV